MMPSASIANNPRHPILRRRQNQPRPAARKGWDIPKAERWLAPMLAYTPAAVLA